MDPQRWGCHIAAAVVAILGLLAASHSSAQPGIPPVQLVPKQLADRYRAVIDANDLTDGEKEVLLSVLEKCAGEQFYMSKLEKAEAVDILKALLKVDAGADPWWLGFVSGKSAPRDLDGMGKSREKAAKYLPSECLSIHHRS